MNTTKQTQDPASFPLRESLEVFRSNTEAGSKLSADEMLLNRTLAARQFVALCQRYNITANDVIQSAFESRTSDDVRHLIELSAFMRASMAKVWFVGQQACEQVYLSSDIGALYRALRDCTWISLPAPDNPEMLKIRSALEKGPVNEYFISAVIASMLYNPLEPWPLRTAFDDYPEWLWKDLLEHSISRPPLFRKTGQLAQHCERVRNWSTAVAVLFKPDRLHDYKSSRETVDSYLKCCDLISPYFIDTDQKELYRTYGSILERSLRLAGAELDWPGLPPVAAESAKIKLGILSSHFWPSAETFVTLSAFEYLDRQRYEITLFSIGSDPANPFQQLCCNHADSFVHLQGSLADKATCIRATKLDFLLIGTNITAALHEVRLLAHYKLARCMLVASCCPVSPGIRTIDYYLSGTFTEEPLSVGSEYHEKCLLVEGPAHAFHYDIKPPLKMSGNLRKNLGVSDTTTVFVSGANFFKIIPELRSAWSKILATVPDSVLVLYPFNPNWSVSYPVALFQKDFHETMKQLGVAPERLLFIKPMENHAAVWNVLGAADIYLDSRPYSGATSLIDPLLAGIPVVTHCGRTARCRQAHAILRCLGMQEMCTETEDQYIALAVKLAAEKEYRKQVTLQLKMRLSANPQFLDPRWYSGEMDRMMREILEAQVQTR